MASTSTTLLHVIAAIALLLCDRVTQKVEAVRCFSCTVKPPSRRKMAEEEAGLIGNNNGENRTRAVKSGQRLCSKFDGSERFVVECPLSTLCKTRMFHLHTHTDSHRVTMRGCAKQDFSYQVYNEAERGWDTVTEIKESIYPEGCFFSAGQTHGLRRHETEYCFCRGDLCNGTADTTATRNTRTPYITLTIAFISCSFPRLILF